MHAIRNYISNVDHMKIADFPILDMQIIKWYLISGYMYIFRRQGEVASFFLSLRQYDHKFIDDTCTLCI
jgi:hypothetical protein